MKKLLRSTLAVCLLLCMVLGLTACGAKPLKEEDVIGTWQTTHVTYTADARNTAGYQSCDYTKAQYVELLAKIDANTATAKEQDDYYALSGFFDVDTAVRADGKIYDVDGTVEYLLASWEIEDGKFVYTLIMNAGLDTSTAEYKNGKIIVTYTIDRNDPSQGTFVYVLEKLPAVA